MLKARRQLLEQILLPRKASKNWYWYGIGMMRAAARTFKQRYWRDFAHPWSLKHWKSGVTVAQCILVGPKLLNQLKLNRCSPLGSIPQQSELFTDLCSLVIWCCSWDSLPDNMELLKSLEKLELFLCPQILLLPVLPLSLKTFRLYRCSDVLTSSCQTIGYENWQKIKHIPNKHL